MPGLAEVNACSRKLLRIIAEVFVEDKCPKESTGADGNRRLFFQPQIRSITSEDLRKPDTLAGQGLAPYKVTA